MSGRRREVQQIGAATGEFNEGVAPQDRIRRERIAVVAITASQAVVARTTDQRVVPITSHQRVVASTTIQEVVQGVANQAIIERSTDRILDDASVRQRQCQVRVDDLRQRARQIDRDVLSGRRREVQQIGAATGEFNEGVAPQDRIRRERIAVVAITASQAVVARTTDQRVVPITSHQRVVASTTIQEVVQGVANQAIIERSTDRILDDASVRQRQCQVRVDDLRQRARQIDRDVLSGRRREVQQIGAATGEFNEGVASQDRIRRERIAIIPRAADQCVIAGTAGEDVGQRISRQRIVLRSADHIFDGRGRAERQGQVRADHLCRGQTQIHRDPRTCRQRKVERVRSSARLVDCIASQRRIRSKDVRIIPQSADQPVVAWTAAQNVGQCVSCQRIVQ